MNASEGGPPALATPVNTDNATAATSAPSSPSRRPRPEDNLPLILFPFP